MNKELKKKIFYVTIVTIGIIEAINIILIIKAWTIAPIHKGGWGEYKGKIIWGISTVTLLQILIIILLVLVIKLKKGFYKRIFLALSIIVSIIIFFIPVEEEYRSFYPTRVHASKPVKEGKIKNIVGITISEY